ICDWMGFYFRCLICSIHLRISYNFQFWLLTSTGRNLYCLVLRPVGDVVCRITWLTRADFNSDIILAVVILRRSLIGNDNSLLAIRVFSPVISSNI
ncbi:MAG: hypothetical protein ACKPFF_28515, partial [Planktothrix sp.]